MELAHFRYFNECIKNIIEQSDIEGEITEFIKEEIRISISQAFIMHLILSLILDSLSKWFQLYNWQFIDLL